MGGWVGDWVGGGGWGWVRVCVSHKNPHKTFVFTAQTGSQADRDHDRDRQTDRQTRRSTQKVTPIEEPKARS